LTESATSDQITRTSSSLTPSVSTTDSHHLDTKRPGYNFQDQELVDGRKEILNKKNIILINSAAGELYFTKQYYNLILLIHWIRDAYDVRKSGPMSKTVRGREIGAGAGLMNNNRQLQRQVPLNKEVGLSSGNVQQHEHIKDEFGVKDDTKEQSVLEEALQRWEGRCNAHLTTIGHQ